jgi:hypothetical protein
MSMKVLLKFLPCYHICICMGHSEGIPAVGRSAFQSPRSMQDFFSVVALSDVQLFSYDLKPIVGVQWINRVRESRWMMAHEISMFTSILGCVLLLGILLVLLVFFNLLH